MTWRLIQIYLLESKDPNLTEINLKIFQPINNDYMAKLMKLLHELLNCL